jgi:hypothetical protein
MGCAGCGGAALAAGKKWRVAPGTNSRSADWFYGAIELFRHVGDCYAADETIYLVVDRCGGRGAADRETEFERTDIETILAELLSGQFNDPVRVIAFNTLEHWSDDISQEIACEIQIRSDIEGAAVPEHVRDFVTSHEGRARALMRA